MHLGIDLGYSSTKAVVMEEGKVVRRSLLPPKFPPPHLIMNFRRISITGGRGVRRKGTRRVDEIRAIANGARFLTKKKRFLVVSIGTGTCLVSVDRGIRHICGTGLGGGTILGLSKLLLSTTDIAEIEKLAMKGRVENVDLKIKDIIGGGIGALSGDLTAANMAKMTTKRKSDIALGIINLVGEVLGVLISYAAIAHKHTTIVIVGRAITIKMLKQIISKTIRLFNLKLIIPKYPEYSTAIGATRC